MAATEEPVGSGGPSPLDALPGAVKSLQNHLGWQPSTAHWAARCRMGRKDYLLVVTEHRLLLTPNSSWFTPYWWNLADVSIEVGGTGTARTVTNRRTKVAVTVDFGSLTNARAATLAVEQAKLRLGGATSAELEAFQTHRVERATRADSLTADEVQIVGFLFLGGTNIGLVPKQRVDGWFLKDRVILDNDERTFLDLPMREVTKLDVSGRGRLTQGGRIIGGGLGPVGAIEGMAIAAVLGSLLTTVTTETLLTIGAPDFEIWLFHDRPTPQELRISLAPAIARIGLLPQSGPASTVPPAGVADELRQLGELHASGVLTDSEFAAAKRRVLGTTE